MRLTDIAARAGVSTATVSRVLNGRPGVGEETRAAVMTAVEELGYTRAEAGRPRHRPTGLIGLIVGEMSNPIFPAFAQGIEHAAAGAGYTQLLCTGSPGGISEQDYLDMLQRHQVDGIVIVSGQHSDTEADLSRYRQLDDLNIPLVVINGTQEEIQAPALSTDEHAAMDLAVRHLAAQGHRRIGLATGPTQFVPTLRKIEGFQTAVARHLPEDPEGGELANSLFTLEGGVAAGTDLIQRGCTAVVCGSDVMALGVIRAARSAGLDVPRDLSVVGFDDSGMVAFTDPPLTTLRQPVDALCRSAMATLLRQIQNQSAERPASAELLFEPELVVRGSTAAAPAELAEPAS